MTDKKRLLFFDVITHFGGAQRSTVLLCERLRQHYDVRILDAYGVCEPYQQAVQDAGIPCEVLFPSARYVYIGHKGRPVQRLGRMLKQIPEMLRLKKALAEAVERLKPDLVWTNSPKALFFLKAAGVQRRCPVVYYARGWGLRKQFSAVQRYLIRHAATCIFTVSRSTAEAIAGWRGQADGIHVVYDVIQMEHLERPAEKPPEPTPAGIDRALKILIPAHLLYTKGQHTAIRAAAILKEKGLDFVLWLAGDTSTLDGGSRYFDYLKQLVEQYGLADYVVFLGYRTDVPALTRAADMVVLPTHTEGLPRAVFESMLLRTPVIATPAGGVTDLILDGKTGLLVPFEDAEMQAKKIEELYQDAGLYKKIVEQAYEHANRLVNPQYQIPLICEAIDKIILGSEKQIV